MNLFKKEKICISVEEADLINRKWRILKKELSYLRDENERLKKEKEKLLRIIRDYEKDEPFFEKIRELKKENKKLEFKISLLEKKNEKLSKKILFLSKINDSLYKMAWELNEKLLLLKKSLDEEKRIESLRSLIDEKTKEIKKTFEEALKTVRGGKDSVEKTEGENVGEEVGGGVDFKA